MLFLIEANPLHHDLWMFAVKTGGAKGLSLEVGLDGSSRDLVG